MSANITTTSQRVDDIPVILAPCTQRRVAALLDHLFQSTAMGRSLRFGGVTVVR
jgi:hypothetical protein